jgi:hypothetical protein
MSLGLAKIKADCLYKELGCDSLAQYLKKLCDDAKMERTSVYKWLYIGEAYIKYQNDLEQIEFNEGDGATKLPYLEMALEKNPKQEVFENIKKMSLRDFITFSKGIPEEAVRPFVTVQNHGIYIDGLLAVKINKKLDKRSYNYFRKVIRIAGRAMEDGEVILPVRLHSMDEASRYEPLSKSLLKKLRKGA